jgi:hypothetical protein
MVEEIRALGPLNWTAQIAMSQNGGAPQPETERQEVPA